MKEEIKDKNGKLVATAEHGKITVIDTDNIGQVLYDHATLLVNMLNEREQHIKTLNESLDIHRKALKLNL